MSSELPYYETMYGVYLQDWTVTYGIAGPFAGDVNYILTKEYYNEGCMTNDVTTLASGSNTIRFLYPFWIKKQYYIEGNIEGHFTVSCMYDDGELTSYEVALWKVDNYGTTTRIGTTGTITPLNVSFTWDATYDVGTEIVYPFTIETTDYLTNLPSEVKVLDKERLYVEITLVTTTEYLILYHSNDATWEDFKISIPFRGL